MVSRANLAIGLRARFEHDRRMEDLEEAISLHHAALEFRPFKTRFEHVRRMEDLEKAISMQRVALNRQPEGYLDRSLLLGNLAYCLKTRFEHGGRTEDLEEAIQSLRLALHPFSDIATRLDIAHEWTTMTRSYDDSTLVEAHRAFMSLLQRALAVKPTLSEQHNFLRNHGHYQSLTLDAASHAIDKGQYTLAIEFLEQGRALLWSQMRGFRTSLEWLSEVDGTLAERFEVCNRRLEALMTVSESCTLGLSAIFAAETRRRSAFQEQCAIDKALIQVRRLSEEQEVLINDIRRIPGFEDFLKAKTFDVLQQAASEGSVIVLNQSKYRYDALIILARRNDPCVCVPLDEAFYTDAINLHEKLIRIRRTLGVGSDEYDEVLRRVMRTLWARVVSKVAQKLKELGIGEGPRIWWCPTSVLSTFPFHAAGPYKTWDGNMKHLLDDYTSSYTPTLTSLINARSGVETGGKRLLFIADTKLPSAEKERKAISRIRRCNPLLDDSATPKAVLKHLQKTRWVHFVCHGQLACHTAEQSPNSVLNEALHLAAGMQFCGFRSVVGTMWKLLDKDGPFLSGAVYRHLMGELEEGKIRFKRAAEAAERWVNLVHIGA
ncbi:hypothetical protein ACEPAG_8953 [Sanghuangporus baumii]